MRPSRKITALSYSLRILIPLISRIAAMIRTVAGGPKPNIASSSFSSWLASRDLSHLKAHTVNRHHLYPLTHANLFVTPSVPMFTVDKNPPCRIQGRPHFSDLPYQTLRT